MTSPPFFPWPGASATVVVRISGPNLDTLQTVAQQTAKSMSGIAGVVDLKSSSRCWCRNWKWN